MSNHCASSSLFDCSARVAVSAIALLVGCFLGCSTDANSVSGRVTLDGQPLPDAMVQFIPQGGTGRIALGRTNSNGDYKLKSSRNITDVAPGSYRVEITTADLAENDDGNERMTPELVPVRFNRQSDVTKEIKAGSNTIDFEIPSK